MNEKNVRWTNEKCEECHGFVLYDEARDEFFCENCGLIQVSKNNVDYDRSG